MTDEKNNITSIHSASKSSSGKRQKDNSSSRYIPPLTSGNQSLSFQLPDNDEIIIDFRRCGGSLMALLKAHIDDKDQHKAAGVAIIEQIKSVKDDWQQFENIRIASEKVEALLAKDELVALGKSKGPGQIQALKEVKAFTKDHPEDKATDPIDQHLDDIPTDEVDE